MNNSIKPRPGWGSTEFELAKMFNEEAWKKLKPLLIETLEKVCTHPRPEVSEKASEKIHDLIIDYLEDY